jgi:hypothetical protein
MKKLLFAFKWYVLYVACLGSWDTQRNGVESVTSSICFPLHNKPMKESGYKRQLWKVNGQSLYVLLNFAVNLEQL